MKPYESAPLAHSNDHKPAFAAQYVNVYMANYESSRRYNTIIAEFAPSPVDFLNAMIEGIGWGQNNPDKFILDTGSFGSGQYQLPCGCVATVSVQQMIGELFSVDRIGRRSARAEEAADRVTSPRSGMSDKWLKDYEYLEVMLDSFRRGHPSPFFRHYYGHSMIKREGAMGRWANILSHASFRYESLISSPMDEYDRGYNDRMLRGNIYFLRTLKAFRDYILVQEEAISG